MSRFVVPEVLLRPSLLDRLINADAMRAAGVDAESLEDLVEQDLMFLLQHRAAAVTGSPGLAESVLNYGMAEVTGRDPNYRSVVDELQARVREAIVRFEPRIDTGTLSINVQHGPSADRLVTPTQIMLTITAEILAIPVRHLEMTARVDLQTSRVS